MSGNAFLFPGQGAQYIGMGSSLAQYPEARRVFEEGNDIVGEDILHICQNGPEEQLASTRVSQPAILLHSIAVIEVLKRRLGERMFDGVASAGLSLGEYSALVHAGALEFEDAVRIVTLRGRYMQDACDESPSGMASIIGLDGADVLEAVIEAEELGVIGIANYNAPDQIVISGELAPLDRAIAACKAKGAIRALRLRVAGAYHSKLMAKAASRLAPHVERLALHAPRIPVFPNYTAVATRDPEEIRNGLIYQIENAVLWEPTIRRIAEMGMNRAIEAGPGRVIIGLLRRIVPGIDGRPLGEAEDIERFVSEEMART